MKAAKIVKAVSNKKSLTSDAERIRKRQSQEIVIALCGFAGCGISTVTEKLSKHFENYNYNVLPIKITDIIKNLSEIEIASSDAGSSIKELQEAGLNIRTKFGPEALAREAIVKIRTEREKLRAEIFSDHIEADKSQPVIPGNEKDHEIRTVSIIDNIKHKSELELLRATYGDRFFLIGVLCPEEERRNRLSINKRISDNVVSEIINRDRKDADKLGVQVSKVLCKSDFFIENSSDHISNIDPKLTRFIELLLGINAHSPTKAEFAMCCAQASSCRSACISKQVGAAIVTEDGDIISVGRNDVPKFGGGLYTHDDGVNDNRCAFRFNRKCKNSSIKEDIKNDAESIISKILPDQDAETISEIISKLTQIEGLTEYSRAIHAEMDAITTAARNGGNGIKNSTLYCTTFPCHNCARHIVSSGIKQVYYIEPYDKSLAIHIHDDSIRVDKPEGDGTNHLRINQFEGIAPRVYLRLFEAGERKRNGCYLELDPLTAKPKIISQIDTTEDNENGILQTVDEVHRR
ncbi:anti-phage dCTP deaminase [Desulfovibrio ferrophilus]|uniref:CMP/dCMP-type deaminase domain-containing protein n=1 Tax=Desulfovibrio ferrophilus TaxID=241368 RepID=A0A2Z6B0R9_9BACT|nr:anti-phage dCTP deaminase [Desulfovibrio ferrophilus]BBD09101.1 uncharacterized protein DFE_2375 [Desulfovibrio ferrophilus]